MKNNRWATILMCLFTGLFMAWQHAFGAAAATGQKNGQITLAVAYTANTWGETKPVHS